MKDFYARYQAILRSARQAGILAVAPDRQLPKQPFTKPEDAQRFLEATHRGFSAAQHEIVTFLQELESDTGLDPEERAFHVLLLRRAADHIAWTLFALKGHEIRRLALHDDPPALDLRTVRAALGKAGALNAESGLTFALLADLTTFIHVADLVRIDFRPPRAEVSFIELKSGKVNHILLEQLANYEPTPSSVALIDEDAAIDPAHRQQAKRMMRQRVRLSRVKEMLATDEGIDIRFEMPIKVQPREISVESYGDLLSSLCEQAEQSGIAGGLAGRCIHLGVATGNDRRESRQRATDALRQAIELQRNQNPPDLVEIARELSASYGIDRSQQLKPYDLLDLNLSVIVGEPFTMWPIPAATLDRILRGTMSVVGAFDLAAFIWLGQKVGVPMRVLSKQETGKAVSLMGARAIPRWGGRAIGLEEHPEEYVLGGGMLSRFIVNLTEPASFLLGTKRTDESEQMGPGDGKMGTRIGH